MTGGKIIVHLLNIEGFFLFDRFFFIASGSSGSGSGSSGGSSSGGTYTVTGSVLNVRSAAGMSAGVVSSLARGAQVTIVETASADGMTWGKLSTGGWVSMNYVK